jgi:hypothetical protein
LSEHRNELSVSLKGGGLIDYLIDCQLTKKDSDACSKAFCSVRSGLCDSHTLSVFSSVNFDGFLISSGIHLFSFYVKI